MGYTHAIDVQIKNENPQAASTLGRPLESLKHYLTSYSTPSERVAWVSYLLAHAGEYGAVTALSRGARVSRQTLYTWLARG